MKPKPLVVSADIYGVRVDVEVDDSAVFRWIEEYLSAFKTSDQTPAKIRFKFVAHPERLLVIPEDAEWFLHYDGLAGLTLDRFFYYRNFGSVWRFDPEECVVEGTLTAELLEQRRYFTHVFFTVVLFEALRSHGLYYIHSAALKSPEGVGIMIPANASCGKSTLSIALLNNGYSYLSDDAVFAKRKAGGIVLLPFVREFHVSPRVAEVFEELGFLKDAPEYFPGNEKRAFRAEDVYPGRFVGEMGLPEVVLFPEIVSDDVSSIERLSTQNALTRMIPNSALVMFSLSAAKSHLGALKEIASGARCFILRSGRDVYNNPVKAMGRILKLLDAR